MNRSRIAMMLFIRTLFPTVTGLLFCGAALAGGADAVNGELAFHRNCTACHSLEAGQNRIGPSLFNVYGRKSASVEGYAYSQTFRRLAVTWSDASLDPYLTDAQQFAPGSKMWIKLPDAQTRQDIIVFLRAQASATKP